MLLKTIILMKTRVLDKKEKWIPVGRNGTEKVHRFGIMGRRGNNESLTETEL